MERESEFKDLMRQQVNYLSTSVRLSAAKDDPVLIELLQMWHNAEDTDIRDEYKKQIQDELTGLLVFPDEYKEVLDCVVEYNFNFPKPPDTNHTGDY